MISAYRPFRYGEVDIRQHTPCDEASLRPHHVQGAGDSPFVRNTLHTAFTVRLALAEAPGCSSS